MGMHRDSTFSYPQPLLHSKVRSAAQFDRWYFGWRSDEAGFVMPQRTLFGATIRTPSPEEFASEARAKGKAKAKAKAKRDGMRVNGPETRAAQMSCGKGRGKKGGKGEGKGSLEVAWIT